MLEPYPSWDSRQLGNTFLLQRRNLKTEAMLETNTSCISCLKKYAQQFEKRKKKTICNENMKSIHLIFYNPNFSFLGGSLSARVSLNIDSVKSWAEAWVGIWWYKLSANSLPVLQHGEDSTVSTNEATLGPLTLLTLPTCLLECFDLDDGKSERCSLVKGAGCSWRESIFNL